MSFVKLMNESLMKSSINNLTKQLSTQEIDSKILDCQNKLSLIKEQYNEIKLSWKSLCEDVEGLSFGNHLAESQVAESFQKTIKDLKIEYEDIKKTLQMYKDLKNKTLLEDQNNQQLDNNLDRLKFKIENQAPYILQELQRSPNPFKTAFDLLVPKNGPAETLAGELIRAIMSIFYSNKYNNDLFYRESGINNCGPAVSFLMENGYWNDFQYIIDNELIADDYISALNRIKDKILDDILNLELLTTVNTFDYTTTEFNLLVDDNQTSYDESLQIIPDNILNENEESLEEDLASIFLRYHDDASNFKANPNGFSRMYKILNRYGTDDENVDDIFRKAPENDQMRMLELITPRRSY